MSPPSRPTLRHVPALDGLRGLALLGVLLFHANGALRGGYLGVDLFFVLSGYLITSLLLAEHQHTGHIALSTFWVRRARRLFPALLSLMPAIALYARFFSKPDELAGLRGDALATLGYVANWRTIFTEKSYWQLFASPSPLEHTWSLSIEEQFYVVWPLLVVLVLRLCRARPDAAKRVVLGLAVVLIALSVTATLYLFDPARTSRVYLGTDTRAAGILVGAALATIVSPGAQWKASTRMALDALGTVAAVGLGVAWWKLEGEDPFLYRGGLWLTELAAGVLIVCAVSGGLIARSLAPRPLRLLGAVSYGVYLWHWPIDVAFSPERLHLHGLALHVVRFAVTFLIAGLSYRYLERPILTRGLPFGRPIYFVPAAVALAVLLLVGGTVTRQGAPSVALSPTPVADGSDVVASDVFPQAFQALVVGDSTANSFGWVMRGVQKPGVRVELRGKDGCTMLADTCDGPSWALTTSEVRPAATLVMLGGAFMHGITADGMWQKSCREEWDKRFESTLEKRLADLRSPEGEVWAATVPYALGVWEGATLRAEVDCINMSIKKATASVPDVHLLDLAEHLCPHGVCEVEADGAVIRPDGVHYSMEGGRTLARWALEQMGGAALAANHDAPRIHPPQR